MKHRINNMFKEPAKLCAGFFLTLNLIFVIFLYSTMNIYAKENDAQTKKVRICIDPGHGGENLGAEWNGYTEKDMTMIVANAMKAELEKYEGIEVYMTRADDTDLELKERVEYASKVDADFFFCLHFNMSENHTLYGAETWISAFGKNYARGMDFSKIEMDLLTEKGLYNRGIKTRMNSKGTNYYGVLRIGDEKNIPGVIIEHCHLDNPVDDPFYDENEALIEYGILDATAVAMYYGLKSDELGVDYSDYSYEKTEIPEKAVKPDDTEPEFCTAEVLETFVTEAEEIQTSATGYPQDYIYKYQTDSYIPIAKVSISAADNESRMLYYAYSVDSGATFSDLLKWEPDLNGNALTVELPLPFDKDVNLQIRAFNLYGLYTDSEIYHIDAIDKPVVEETIETIQDVTEIHAPTYDDLDIEIEKNRYKQIVIFSALGIMSLITVSICGYALFYTYKRKRKG